MTWLRRLTDGVLFQAVLTGSLSFSHIHDLAAAHGQAGWKAWLYPLSVDLLTVAAYRKLMAARHADAPMLLAWCSFLLGLAASLAANIVSAWQNPDRFIAVALGVWPAVAFLVCTLLAHDPATVAEVPAEAPEMISKAPEVPSPAPIPETPAIEPEKPVQALPAPVQVALPRPRQVITKPRQTVVPRDGSPDPLFDAAKAVNAAALADSGRPAGVARLRVELRVGQARAQSLRDLLREVPEAVTHANGHDLLGATG